MCGVQQAENTELVNFLLFSCKHDLDVSWWDPKTSSNVKGTRLVYKTWEAQLCLPNTNLNLFLIC